MDAAKNKKERTMTMYFNTNNRFGETGPFEADSKEDLADKLMPMFKGWASESEEIKVEDIREEFIDGLKIHAEYDLDGFTNILKRKLEKLSQEFGGHENIILTEEAHPACDPSRENGWDCLAVRLDGYHVELGVVKWDFEIDLEDPSDYDWEFGDIDFTPSYGSIYIDNMDEDEESILEENI